MLVSAAPERVELIAWADVPGPTPADLPALAPERHEAFVQQRLAKLRACIDACVETAWQRGWRGYTVQLIDFGYVTDRTRWIDQVTVRRMSFEGCQHQTLANRSTVRLDAPERAVWCMDCGRTGVHRQGHPVAWF